MALVNTGTARAIVALDVADASAARRLVEMLGDDCDFVKVGSELFTAAGPELVRTMQRSGHDVFLDLKFHDIPNTVRGAARTAAGLGASLITVHASGGARMLEAAVAGAGNECGVLAVSVLTSLDAAQLAVSWGRSIELVEREVLRLAQLAIEAGAHGLVCSGLEARAVRDRFGDALALLIPGIRFSGDSAHDQARVITPAAAVEAGARYLVLGRAVTSAAAPREALRQARVEISSVRRD